MDTVKQVNGWRSSRLASLLVIAVFLAIQVSVPISRLIHDTPQRFGWQMYSSGRPATEFTVTTSDGVISVNKRDFLAAARAEIAYEELLPPHLCVVIADAVAVEWEEGEYQC